MHSITTPWRKRMITRLFLIALLIAISASAPARTTQAQAFCGTIVTCITPNANPTTNANNIQNAVNIFHKPVLFLPGDAQINRTINVTQEGTTLMAMINNGLAGISGSVPPYPFISRVSAASTFPAGQPLFKVTNQNVHFSGFKIKGYDRENPGSHVDCIDVGDSGLVIDGNMSLEDCWDGVHIDLSVGSTTGQALNTHLNHMYITYPGNNGVFCDASCTDFFFGPNIAIEVAGNFGIELGSNATQGSIKGNDIEDGATCIGLATTVGSQGPGFIDIEGNRCVRMQMLFSDGAFNIILLGNSYSGVEGFVEPALQFRGQNFGWLIANNYCKYQYTACYQVDAGGSWSGLDSVDQNSPPPSNTAIYADQNTMNMFVPSTVVVP